MRNPLLILASAAVLLGLAWWWTSADTDRTTEPSGAAPTASPAPPQPRAAQPEPTQGAAELTQPDSQRPKTETDSAAARGDIEQVNHDEQRDPKRSAQEIIELVQKGRVGHARALAERFYRAFPGNPEIPQIERLTGYHPRPYGPGNIDSK